MTPEIHFEEKQQKKNLLLAAAEKLGVKINEVEAIGKLDLVLNAGDFTISTRNTFVYKINRELELEKSLIMPQDLGPLSGDICLAFWTWGWQSKSGDQNIPMTVNLIKFEEHKPIGDPPAYSIKSVELGKVNAYTDTLVTDNKLPEVKNSFIYSTSNVLIPLKKI